MRLLLDTHVALWWFADARQLGAEPRRAIQRADVVWVSAVSGWEVAIKQSLGKLRLSDAFGALVTASEFTELRLTLAHAERLATLPSHHADPFDRMLVAQAQAEGARLVTHDRRLHAYDVPLIRV
ncbi:MAG: type II toxin-antitoxin system VapC family toxin [Vicinamibacterales bacterium]